MVKNLPTVWEVGVWSLEKGMGNPSSILVWKIPWTEEPGRLQSIGLQRVGHNWATNTFHFWSLVTKYQQFFSYLNSNCDNQKYFQALLSVSWGGKLLLPIQMENYCSRGSRAWEVGLAPQAHFSWSPGDFCLVLQWAWGSPSQTPFISFGTMIPSEPSINSLHKDSLRVVTTSSLRTWPNCLQNAASSALNWLEALNSACCREFSANIIFQVKNDKAKMSNNERKEGRMGTVAVWLERWKWRTRSLGSVHERSAPLFHWKSFTPLSKTIKKCLQLVRNLHHCLLQRP